MEKGVMVSRTEPKTTIGLLGVDVSDLLQITHSGVFSRMATDRRLAEIERRILAIEAMVWPLGR